MDDLSLALGEHGVNVNKPDYCESILAAVSPVGVADHQIYNQQKRCRARSRRSPLYTYYTSSYIIMPLLPCIIH